MKPITNTISLDLLKNGSQAVVALVKGDSNADIIMDFREGDAPYHLTDEYGVFTALKEDGNYIFDRMCRHEDKMIYHISPNITSAQGLLACQVKLCKRGEPLADTWNLKIDEDEDIGEVTTHYYDYEYSQVDGSVIGRNVVIYNAETGQKELRQIVGVNLSSHTVTFNSAFSYDGTNPYINPVTLIEASPQFSIVVDDSVFDITGLSTTELDILVELQSELAQLSLDVDELTDRVDALEEEVDDNIFKTIKVHVDNTNPCNWSQTEYSDGYTKEYRKWIKQEDDILPDYCFGNNVGVSIGMDCDESELKYLEDKGINKVWVQHNGSMLYILVNVDDKGASKLSEVSFDLYMNFYPIKRAESPFNPSYYYSNAITTLSHRNLQPRLTAGNNITIVDNKIVTVNIPTITTLTASNPPMGALFVYDHALYRRTHSSTTIGLQEHCGQSNIDINHKLNASYVDDSNSDKKFTTSEQRTAWNNKIDLQGLKNYANYTNGNINIGDNSIHYTQDLATKQNAKPNGTNPLIDSTTGKIDPRYYNSTGTVPVITNESDISDLDMGALFIYRIPNTSNYDLYRKTASAASISLQTPVSQPTINIYNKVKTDCLDDTNQTNKFTNATEKANWNAKPDKTDVVIIYSGTSDPTSISGAKAGDLYINTQADSFGNFRLWQCVKTTTTTQQWEVRNNTMHMYDGDDDSFTPSDMPYVAAGDVISVNGSHLLITGIDEENDRFVYVSTYSKAHIDAELNLKQNIIPIIDPDEQCTLSMGAYFICDGSIFRKSEPHDTDPLHQERLTYGGVAVDEDSTVPFAIGVDEDGLYINIIEEENNE